MSERDPFNTGRILSGRVHVKDINFTFSIWGYRTISSDEALDLYESWKRLGGRPERDIRRDVLLPE